MAKWVRVDKTTTSSSSSKDHSSARGFAGFKFPLKLSGRGLINSSKKLLISMKWGRREREDDLKAYDRAAMEEEGGGEFLWQRSILMGERCQPPDFSGLIIYDDKGNRLPEFPARSPKLNNIIRPSLDQSDTVQQR